VRDGGSNGVTAGWDRPGGERITGQAGTDKEEKRWEGEKREGRKNRKMKGEVERKKRKRERKGRIRTYSYIIIFLFIF
jgi:hypothetical protein